MITLITKSKRKSLGIKSTPNCCIKVDYAISFGFSRKLIYIGMYTIQGRRKVRIIGGAVANGPSK